MNLETLKNQYAQEQGYEDWADLYRRAGYYDETEFFKHENAVFILAQKAALEKAAENVKMKTKENISELSMMDDWSEIDQNSITNPENLIQ